MKFRFLQIFFLIILIGIIFLSLESWNYLWWILPLFGVYFGIISWGSSNIRSGLFVKSLSSSNKEKQLALTFDDGPQPVSLEILKVLKKFDVKATFFCIGKNVEEHPEILGHILKQGHTVGNHTYSHPVKWGWLNTAQVKEEIEKCDAALEKATAKPNLLFRPPFGVTNPRIARALKNMPHHVIGWDLRSLDTAIHDKQRLYDRIIARIHSSSIALFHDSQPHTPEVLERVLGYCKEAGIKIVPLGELLEIET